MKYDILCFIDDQEEFPPSNKKALEYFRKAAENNDINLIFKSFKELLVDENRYNYDGYFIRCETHLGYPFTLADKVQEFGKFILDSPKAIFVAGSKVETYNIILQDDNIPCPITLIIKDKSDIDCIYSFLEFPFIIKKDRSCFSRGIFKIQSKEEFIELLNSKDINFPFICQQYMYTDYDWRIGILDNKPLFACKYFMAKNSWKILDYDQKMKEGEGIGRHECVDIKNVPKEILEIAVSVSRKIGDGLFGIDIKEKNGKYYFIEINDNVSIDAGVEDGILGLSLYDTIMKFFVKKINDVNTKM